MIWAILIGYVIGTLPTADAFARLRSIDLHSEGSGNPGAANALLVGGRKLAVAVLIADLLKGASAVAIGRMLVGDPGAAAGVAAVAGQILNPWHRFRGGKGLAVSSGAAAAAFPPGFAATIPIIVASAKAFGTAVAGLITLTALLGLAIIWASTGWPVGWGIRPDDTLVWVALGVATVAAPKFASQILAGRRG